MSNYKRDSVFNVQKHRRNANYRKEEFVMRISWMLGRVLFRMIPRFFYEARNKLLRMYGAKIGHSVRLYPTVKIFFPWNIEIGDEVTISDGVQLYSLGKIKIGDGTMISYGAHFCAGTHDYRYDNLPLLKPEITLGRGIWICAEAFVGPGVCIGDYSIIGARAVVTKSFEARSILAGNPARRVKERPLPATAELEAEA